MPFLPPNQQCQSTEGINTEYTWDIIINICKIHMLKTFKRCSNLSKTIKMSRLKTIKINYKIAVRNARKSHACTETNFSPFVMTILRSRLSQHNHTTTIKQSVNETSNQQHRHTHSQCVRASCDIPARTFQTQSVRHSPHSGRPSPPCALRWRSCMSVSAAWSYPSRSRGPRACECSLQTHKYSRKLHNWAVIHFWLQKLVINTETFICFRPALCFILVYN